MSWKSKRNTEIVRHNKNRLGLRQTDGVCVYITSCVIMKSTMAYLERLDVLASG